MLLMLQLPLLLVLCDRKQMLRAAKGVAGSNRSVHTCALECALAALSRLIRRAGD
jgi:hypothetical protein